jgi:hypothetical protein
LTNAGRELFPVIVAIMHWGDKWIYSNSEVPIQLYDDRGRVISPVLVNKNTGEPIIYGRVHANLGSVTHKAEWDALQSAVNEGRQN